MFFVDGRNDENGSVHTGSFLRIFAFKMSNNCKSYLTQYIGENVLFIFIRFKQHFAWETLYFNEIWTQIVGFEGKNANHYGQVR